MIGIDEVGRGAWAGPLLIVAARAKSELPVGLKDSKLLSKKQRLTLLLAIQESCDLGEGWVEASEIDAVGLTQGMRLGVKRALESIQAEPNEEIIMDGSINYCKPSYKSVKCIVRADSEYPVVSAASVYAKVIRDKYMAELSVVHPNYGFEKHVGYGTKLHILALRKYGLTNVHRLSYKPVGAFV